MTDKAPESGLEVPESVAPPVPEISEPSGDERPSAAAVSTDDLVRLDRKLDEITKSLQAQVRGLQGGVDRQLSKLTNVEALARQLGVEPQKVADAQRQIVLNEIVDERLGSQTNDPGRSKVAENRDTSVILAEVKNDLGVEIAPDDPDLQTAGKKTYGSWDSWKAEIYKLAARKAKQANAPTSVVAETPQRAPSAGTVDSAQDKLARLQANPKTTTADLQSASNELREALSRQR